MAKALETAGLLTPIGTGRWRIRAGFASVLRYTRGRPGAVRAEEPQNRHHKAYHFAMAGCCASYAVSAAELQLRSMSTNLLRYTKSANKERLITVAPWHSGSPQKNRRTGRRNVARRSLPG